MWSLLPPIRRPCLRLPLRNKAGRKIKRESRPDSGRLFVCGYAGMRFAGMRMRGVRAGGLIGRRAHWAAGSFGRRGPIIRADYPDRPCGVVFAVSTIPGQSFRIEHADHSGLRYRSFRDEKPRRWSNAGVFRLQNENLGCIASEGSSSASAAQHPCSALGLLLRQKGRSSTSDAGVDA